MAAGYLNDTCVVSEATKPQPDQAVVRWMDSVDESRMFISTLTIGELLKGISLMDSSPRKLAIQGWFERSLPRRFERRIIPVDSKVAETWGLITADLRAKGITIGVVDALIAATALTHGLTVVTRNVREFQHTAARILNPWDL